MRLNLRSSVTWNGVNEIKIEHYPFVLGRHTTTDFSLPLAFVSRQHCQFMLHEKEVFIQDLESFNGTYVNGQRICEPTPVRDGDQLSLGPLQFNVELVTEERETRTDLPHLLTRQCV